MTKRYSPERATTYRDSEHKRRTLKLKRDTARKLKAARARDLFANIQRGK